MFAPTVPLINVMCVAVLSIWGAHDEPPDFARVARRIAANPLILGCLAGLAANLSGVFQTGPIADTAALVGRAALPLILLTIGAGLDFSALRAQPGILTLAVALKLIVAPLAFMRWAWRSGWRVWPSPCWWPWGRRQAQPPPTCWPVKWAGMRA